MTRLEAQIAGHVDPMYGDARDERIKKLEEALAQREYQLQCNAEHLARLETKLQKLEAHKVTMA